jgi:hypothetical protein
MNHEARFLRDRPRSHPDCLSLVIELQYRLTLRERRRFYRRLHEQARQLGLLFSHAHGACVFFGAEHICGSIHRHRLPNWLSDQPEVRVILLGQLGNLTTLARHAQGVSPGAAVTQDERQAARLVFAMLARRAAHQWVRFVEGRIR